MTKRFKYFETESGRKIRKAQFDGYSIAERLLEGMPFQVEVKDDGTLDVTVDDDDKDYFSQFNTERFLKEMLNESQRKTDC